MEVQSSLQHMCCIYCNTVSVPQQAMTWYVKIWSLVFFPVWSGGRSQGCWNPETFYIVFKLTITGTPWQSEGCALLLLQALESLLDVDNKLSHSSALLCCTCSILSGAPLNRIVFRQRDLPPVENYRLFKFQIPNPRFGSVRRMQD